ncbi:Phosphoribosyl transferase domain protein [Candidatus Desulfosporosinus infrequens]|uniref:Phosphoribosyl transferase domain protein n=1 Tax=Candidatus Desulfosporosinus infrequens TaxID=2043169 RepID=A0A2U3LVU2_9FIRM|nr:Phosphoribosyl transferase domain protein [Candidatus Desulfosporosinus infrequens]
MMGFWKEATKITQALWFANQQACAFCGGEQAGVICPTCTTDYLQPELERCRRCGKLILSEKLLCLDCEAGRGPKYLDQVTAWGYYSGGLKDLIQKVKFEANPRSIRAIARPFSDWAISKLPVVDGIVPVPMHATRLAERGFNQAEVISSALHWELGLPILRGVERIEPTLSQVPLSRQERLHNLKGAFGVFQPQYIEGKSVWLVDDVTTTGATLEAVAKALLGSGVVAIYGLCLAAGLEKKLVPLRD